MTILLVDDEPTLRSVFADLLSAKGYRCVTAANAIDAMQIIEANVLTLDLVVTDVKLPGELNGLDLAKKMRQLQPAVAILLISGFPQSAWVKEAEALGYRVLEKPFRHFQLEAAVEEELAKRSGSAASPEHDGEVVSLQQARDKGQR